MITHHTEPDGTLVIRVSSEDESAAKAVRIAEVAAEHFGVSLKDLLGNGRSSDLVDARGMAMLLSRAVASTDCIMRLYGKRRKASVRRARERCLRLMQVEPSFARRYEALRAAVIEDGEEARSA